MIKRDSWKFEGDWEVELLESLEGDIWEITRIDRAFDYCDNIEQACDEIEARQMFEREKQVILKDNA